MTTDRRYRSDTPVEICPWTVQDVLVELDKIVSRFKRPLEGQWQQEVWEDLAIVGNEAAGAIVVQRRQCGFKARTAIINNPSNLEFTMSGGIVIPKSTSEFIARVKPPRDIFQIVVLAAGNAGGQLFVFLTDELIRPTLGNL